MRSSYRFVTWYVSNTDPATIEANFIHGVCGWIKTQNDAEPLGTVLGTYLRNPENTAWITIT